MSKACRIFWCILLHAAETTAALLILANDVVAIANENVLFHHELAYAGPDALNELRELKETYRKLNDQYPVIITVKEDEVSLSDAVASYLFNSQLVTLPDESLAIICPSDCMETESTRCYLEKLLQMDNPISAVHPIDVRQSMQNGGGPACLRLRIVLTEAQLQATHPSIFLTKDLYQQLVDWVEQHYRDSLKPEDMTDPDLLTESRNALDELTTILNLGRLYEFQYA
jgi:succinylarginine dihydrolase